MLEECLAVARSIGTRWGVAEALHRLAMVVFRDGDPQRATTLVGAVASGLEAPWMERAHAPDPSVTPSTPA